MIIDTKPMRIVFLGDVVARPGRTAVIERCAELKRTLAPDLLIANGENASGGLGLTAKSARELLATGVDVLTSGNHIWKHKEIATFIEETPRLLRPANYPPGAPGRGWTLHPLPDGAQAAVINVMGRTFMEAIDCPFRAMDELLKEIPETVRVRIVDFHAEATSEKIALAYYLDGKVSAVFGTHTHVQTNDARVLSGGTAYITDAGMCGVTESILGMDPTPILQRFLRRMPTRFVPAEGKAVLQGVVADFDAAGKALSIQPFSL